MELRELATVRSRSATRFGIIALLAGMKNMETVASTKVTV
jgi:hypothetical protein